MKSLGQYTLGDEYVSPQNRLSRLLMQQGSQGGPSGSWQETMGRIAQQLSGAYMGMQDQKQHDNAYSMLGKQQPDTFTNMPTLDDEQIMNSQGIRDILTAKTDEDFMQNPQIQNAMRGIGGSQDQINQEESFIKNAQDQQIKDKFADAFGNESRGRYVNPEATDREISMGRESIGRANANIDQQSEVFNAAMSRMRGNQPTQDQRGDMVAAELQKQRQASMQPTLDAKMPQRDFMMQNLQGMENNPYAKRLMAQMQLQGMDQDYTAGLANTARSQELEDAKQGHTWGMERDVAKAGMDAPSTRKESLPNGMVQDQELVGGKWGNVGEAYPRRDPYKQVVNVGPNGETSINYVDTRTLGKDGKPKMIPVGKKPDGKQASDYRSARDNVERVGTSLDTYEKLLKENGAEIWPGKTRLQMQTAHTDLLMEMKELLNLGVLNGPDLELMESMIINPTSLRAKGYEMFGGTEGMLEQLNLVRKKLDAAGARADKIYGGKLTAKQNRRSTDTPAPPSGFIKD